MKLVTIMFLASGLSLQSFAGPSKDVRDYSLRVREASISFSKLAKEARGNKDVIANDTNFKQIVDSFNIEAKDQARLAQAVADGKTNIITAMYASVAAKQLIETNKVENQDMDSGILNLVKVASVSGKGMSSDKNLNLSADEMKLATGALKKKTEYTIDMLSWSKDDAALHIAVMNKTAEIYKNNKITPEEALVLAIMEVKGVDRDAALKIVKKLNDCV